MPEILFFLPRIEPFLSKLGVFGVIFFGGFNLNVAGLQSFFFLLFAVHSRRHPSRSQAAAQRSHRPAPTACRRLLSPHFPPTEVLLLQSFKPPLRLPQECGVGSRW